MFAFRLAALLGWENVEYGLARMSSREFSEWMIVMRNGWLDWDEEYRSALVASVVANTARDERKRKKPFEPGDFMREKYHEKSSENLAQKIERIFSVFGIVRNDGGTGEAGR